MRRFAKEEKGATSVIVAFALVVLLGFAALVVDAGVLFQERRHLQNAVDAAALAGTQQIPIDVYQATEQAYVYAEKNGVSRDEIVENHIVTTFNPGDSLKVTARRKVDLFFARVLGTNFQYVEVQAKGILTKIQPKHIWPWGVTQESLVTSAGAINTLKVGARNSMTGNFMALDLPSGSGADSYREYIEYGFCSAWSITPCPVPAPVSEDPETYAWVVDTETGNVAGPTQQGVSWVLGAPSDLPPDDIRNPRIGLVPILSAWSWDDVAGKSSVTIVGFAVFSLMDIDTGPQGLAEVTGQFRQFAYGVGKSTDIGGPLEGLIGARLWE